MTRSKPVTPVKTPIFGDVQPAITDMRQLLSVFLLFLFVLPVSAQSVGVGLRVGTTGPGITIGVAATERLTIRGGASYFTYSDVVSLTDAGDDVQVDADAEGTIGAASLFVDFKLIGPLRLTGGAAFNLLEAKATGRPTESYCLGTETADGCDGKLFAPDRLGTLQGTLSYPQVVQPYIGLGFGHLAQGRSRVTFLMDLGVLYAGPPEFDLEANGLLAPTASDEQVDELNAGIESFSWYPVFSIGFGIRI